MQTSSLAFQCCSWCFGVAWKLRCISHCCWKRVESNTSWVNSWDCPIYDAVSSIYDWVTMKTMFEKTCSDHQVKIANKRVPDVKSERCFIPIAFILSIVFTAKCYNAIRLNKVISLLGDSSLAAMSVKAWSILAPVPFALHQTFTATFVKSVCTYIFISVT